MKERCSGSPLLAISRRKNSTLVLFLLDCSHVGPFIQFPPLPVSTALYSMWALQVQFLLQIIVNRLCILLATESQRVRRVSLLNPPSHRIRLELDSLGHRSVYPSHQHFCLLYLDSRQASNQYKVPRHKHMVGSL